MIYCNRLNPPALTSGIVDAHAEHGRYRLLKSTRSYERDPFAHRCSGDRHRLNPPALTSGIVFRFAHIVESAALKSTRSYERDLGALPFC